MRGANNRWSQGVVFRSANRVFYPEYGGDYEKCGWYDIHDPAVRSEYGQQLREATNIKFGYSGLILFAERILSHAATKTNFPKYYQRFWSLSSEYSEPQLEAMQKRAQNESQRYGQVPLEERQFFLSGATVTVGTMTVAPTTADLKHWELTAQGVRWEDACKMARIILRDERTRLYDGQERFYYVPTLPVEGAHARNARSAATENVKIPLSIVCFSHDGRYALARGENYYRFIAVPADYRENPAKMGRKGDFYVIQANDNEGVVFEEWRDFVSLITSVCHTPSIGPNLLFKSLPPDKQDYRNPMLWLPTFDSTISFQHRSARSYLDRFYEITSPPEVDLVSDLVKIGGAVDFEGVSLRYRTRQGFNFYRTSPDQDNPKLSDADLRDLIVLALTEKETERTCRSQYVPVLAAALAADLSLGSNDTTSAEVESIPVEEPEQAPQAVDFQALISDAVQSFRAASNEFGRELVGSL